MAIKRIFDIPKHMEAVMSSVEEGREPDPETLRSLVEEGPQAIDSFCHAIANAETAIDALSARIKELRTARDRHVVTAASMRRKLQEVIACSFSGKVETHEYICWIQDEVLRIRPAGRKTKQEEA